MHLTPTFPMPRRRLAPIALLCAAAALAPPALAQTDTADPPGIEAVEEAYNAGDFVAARAGLLPHAEGGNAVAQYRLGYMMATASGGPYDLDGAKKWLEAAIAQDHRAGFTLLARLYLSGEPELPDYVRAAELLQIAVDDDSAEAHFYLGQLYRIGRGVAPDKERAFELIRKAADAGVAPAQFAAAQMYSRGEGVGQDAAQGARWLLQAAEAGNAEAQMSLYFNYSRGTGFPKDEAKARAYLEAAAAGGHTLAERILGAALLTGEGGAAEAERGIELLRRAAADEEPGAQTNLGYAYATGTGVPQDDAEAAAWYKRAADQGLTRAALAMGGFYEIGRGVEKDLAAAIRYYRIADYGRDATAAIRLGALVLAGAFPDELPEQGAVWVAALAETDAEDAESARDWLRARAARGDAYADYRIGRILRDGLGVAADPKTAAVHFLDAARGGIRDAQAQMAEYYAAGTGVPQDYIEAHKWANVAAAGGSDDAAARRDVLADLMTAEQVAEAQARAKSFLQGQ